MSIEVEVIICEPSQFEQKFKDFKEKHNKICISKSVNDYNYSLNIKDIKHDYNNHYIEYIYDYIDFDWDEDDY